MTDKPAVTPRGLQSAGSRRTVYGRRRHRLARTIITLLLAIAVVVGVIAVVRALVRVPFIDVSIIPPDHCIAVVGNYSGTMTPEQAGNAAIIVGEAIQRGLPARAATIAIVTASQESGLRNLNYGDADSLGLFQQRPSQGWGTPDQIMDPWYSAGKFYDALVKVKDWQTGDIGTVAQAVQRSAYPDAYAKHESAGRAIASALTGETPAALRCIANNGQGGGGDDLTALLAKIWGNAITITSGTDAATGASTVTVTAPDATTAWAVAQISMAQLASSGLTSVQVGDQNWTHQSTDLAQWAPSRAAAQDNTVVITLR